MKIPRMSIITLGVADLARATDFYQAVLGVSPMRLEGVSFVPLPGVWLSLYPLDKLAADIGPDVPRHRAGFAGFTLAHNTRKRADVDAVLAHAAASEARIVKPAQDTFWGGYAGYFEDLDGYLWEIAWGPMFEFDADGTLRLPPDAA